ncbi:hypothetical protein EDD36DRAFT_415389 [Exophiala viscosa]|uniref:DUF6606 domain-containing protein n=1 Tax=Exophiala viscosa TaxID=2486360 RepID=A0AAN6IGC4_9EURO|nr:hypothetical protein EDD36DRAFT_415389 [Exophiala viscosa]
MDPKLLRGVFNHVVLPPNVPGSADKNLSEINCDLLGRLHTACAQLKASLDGHYVKELDLLLCSLAQCRSLHTSLHPDAAQLLGAFRSLKDGEVLIVHIVEQNAGLLINYGSDSSSGHVRFEAFLKSPRNPKASDSLRMPCNGTFLLRQPAYLLRSSRTSVSRDIWPSFWKKQASSWSRSLARSQTKQSRGHEPRDSTNPALITGMLISLLEGIGDSVAVTHPTRKRVRDEVRWKDSYIPWRRSPFWLLARVGILRHLEQLTSTAISNALYKALMCLVHANLLEDTVGVLSPENSQLLLSKLCRRIAKVEKDALLATPGSDASAAYTIIIENLRPFLSRLTKTASDRLEATWESYKDRTKLYHMERFEKMMPYNRGEGFAVLMELLCPATYRAYRNATWATVAILALPNLQASRKNPLSTVHEYYLAFAPELQAPTRKGITLASVHFPVPFEKVAVNNGLKFEYYDQVSKLWPAEHLADITFRHHCAIPILRGSPFSKIEYLSKIAFERTSVDPTETFCPFTHPVDVARYVLPEAKISSNEILAGLPQCPQTLSAQEFVAFKDYSAETTDYGPPSFAEAVMLLTQALHGRTGGNHDGDLHTANAIFRDMTFCRKLLSQVDRRLQSIASNWRENYCMEILISLILKLIMLADEETAQHASKLLLASRKTTMEWIRAIRKDFWATTDAQSSERLSHFILWAALLCRRTFTNVNFRDRRVQEDFSKVEINGYAGEHEMAEVKLFKLSLSAFVDASISMQENLPPDPAQLAPLLRNALIRDLKMVFHLEKTLRRSLDTNPSCLISAAVQSEILTRGPAMIVKPQTNFDERADGVWARLDVPGNARTDPMSLGFHLFSGTFLINGQVLERELPPNIRDTEAIKRLLPYHRLVVYPSCLPGMTYKIGLNIEGHEIHLGFRQGKLVIRALTSQDELEYIPSSVFQGDQAFDLPASLTENCVHWLRLQDGVIEVRKAQKIWRPQPSNWQINLSKQIAQRRTSLLVDPSSPFFSFVARIFQHFEEPRHITLYQPQKGALSVELRRFELSFFVNGKGLLESEQLKAEIDLNQDAGTWFGLLPKIILRDSSTPKNRSVIVPLGPLRSERRGLHVAVTIDTTEPAYGRFSLDDTPLHQSAVACVNIILSSGSSHRPNWRGGGLRHPGRRQRPALYSPHSRKYTVCRYAPGKLVHILTYAAPVTPRMLQFNNLDYYAVPTLPVDWSAPLWLRVQLGIFAGRLYFPFEELPYLRIFLGLEEQSGALTDDMPDPVADNLLFDDPSTSSNEQQPSINDNKHPEETTEAKAIRSAKLRQTKMLTFLHAWLSTRARGQDFTHTAMGLRLCTEEETGRHVTGDAGDDDDMSDYGDEDLDEGRKLTEEELKEFDEGRVKEQFVDEVNVSGDEGADASEEDGGDGDGNAPGED